MSSDAELSSRMEKERDYVTAKVLKLTLEIIRLLTGEDYGPIKNSTTVDGDQSATPEPDPSSLKPEKNHEKILEIIDNISVLLTREVPVRCHDVTVTLTLEEWEYLEGHSDMYRDVLCENPLPLPSLGESIILNTERSPSPHRGQGILEESIESSQLNEVEHSDGHAQSPKAKEGLSHGPTEKEGLTQGHKERDGLNQGSKDRDCLTQGSKERGSSTQGSKERDGLAQGSKERDGLTQGSKERDGLTQGSKESDDLNQGSKERDDLNQGSEERDGLAQTSTEREGLTQSPQVREGLTQSPKDGGILQAVINDLERVSKCRQEEEMPKDHKQEVSLFPKSQTADQILKDSRQDVDSHPNENVLEVDQIQRDCRKEIDLIRQICRQEVETILRDCKREIERIQKDIRPERSCSPREYKQESSHIATDCNQELERTAGDCKAKADPVLKDCKQEVDSGPRECRSDVDCKKEIEEIPDDCRQDLGQVQKDSQQVGKECEQEDNQVQHVYEDEQLKDVKIEILSDDEWDDEEWDVQYKDDDDLIYINTDESGTEDAPEKSSEPVYIDDEYESPQAYQRPPRPEEKAASSSGNNSNTQMVQKIQPTVGTASPVTLNNNAAKRGPMPQRTFSPGQREASPHLGTPPNQEHAQTGQQQKNINTARKTTSDIQTLQNFLSEFNENRKVEDIPHTELDTLLSKFLLVVKRKDGNEYEPHTLRCMVGSIDRYLKEHSYMHTIVYGNSKDFPLTKQSLNAKIKFLKKISESNPPTRQEALTDNDIDNLYKSGTLSMDNPTSLLNLVFFNNGLHFALRTKEQYNLQWGDIRLKIDPRGNQYLEYSDRQMEIVENRKNSRHVKPRMYATPHTPDKDPVTAYLKYRSFRPPTMMVHDAPFYLAPNVNYNPAFSEWFRSTKIGIQKIRAMMTTMKIRASLPESKKKVGYMTKKRLVERLPQHLLAAPSSAQASPNNIRSGMNLPGAAELMHHKLPPNMPPTVPGQMQDQRFASNNFQPRPSTSRYGEPPAVKRSFADADMVQHHGTMLQRNPQLYLNSYSQVPADDPAKKRRMAGYDYNNSQ